MRALTLILAVALWLGALVRPALARDSAGDGDLVEEIDLGDEQPEPGVAPDETGDPGGDVTESIDLGDGDGGAAGGAGDTTESTGLDPDEGEPSAKPSVDERFQLRGFFLTTGAVGFNDNRTTAPAGAAVPYDRLLAVEDLYLSLRYARGDSLEAVLSGLLTYTVASPSPGGDGSESDTRYVFEAGLREAYVGLYKGKPQLDLRIGQQRIVWGNSDAYLPNDILNARDLRDRARTSADITELPTLALRADATNDCCRAQLVLAPFFTPDEFEVYGSNWALIQPDAPELYRRLFAAGVADGDALNRGQLPPYDLSGAAAGVALKYKIGDIDVSHYYHYGYDRSPVLEIDPSFLGELAMLQDVSMASIGALFDNYAMMGVDPISTRYVRRHHVGADLQTTAGPFVFRADGAYDTAMVFPRRDLSGQVNPALQGVVGVEWQAGDLDEKLVLVEAWTLQIFDHPDPDKLLGYKHQNYSLAAAIRWPLIADLGVSVKGDYGIMPRGYTVRPELVWDGTSVEVRIGALLLGGEEGSFGHYYRRNRGAHVNLKYSF